jgi:hypothetical protein
MSRVGMVAKEVSDDQGNLACPDEQIAIGPGTQARVRRSGYLYALANDSWEFYFNNRGTVRLTTTRQ